MPRRVQRDRVSTRLDENLAEDAEELLRYWHNGDRWAITRGDEEIPKGHVLKPLNRSRVRAVRTVEDLRRLRAREHGS